MVDTSVFHKGVSYRDNVLQNQKQALEMEFLKRRAQGMAGNNPAAIQIANEIQRARGMGDTQRVNDIISSAKLFDRGVAVDQSGNPVAMGGYGDAIGSIAGTKKGYETQAQKNVDLGMNPQIGFQTEQAKVKGKDIATKGIELNERMASLPQLEDTAEQLSALGQKATYTKIGQGVDAGRRQLDIEPRDGAVAREEYISLVANQILPLLRQTFGAQFTEREGESLKATLGNPNVSPQEKDAVLRSFIEQKKATINSMERELSIPPTSFDEMNQYQQPINATPPAMPQALPVENLDAPQRGQVIDGYLFNGGDPSVKSNWKKVR